MTELSQMMEQFVKSGILTEEAVATLIKEFDNAVKDKADEELSFRVDALKAQLAEEAKVAAAKDFRSKEITIVEEAEKYIELSVKEKSEAEKAQLRLEVKKHKEVLEEQVLNTINDYIRQDILPNVNKIIIEEELTKAKKKLLEESRAKDQAIQQLTEITNQLSRVIQENKDETESVYLKKQKRMAMLEEELARRKQAEENQIARKASIVKGLKEEASDEYTLDPAAKDVTKYLDKVGDTELPRITGKDPVWGPKIDKLLAELKSLGNPDVEAAIVAIPKNKKGGQYLKELQNIKVRFETAQKIAGRAESPFAATKDDVKKVTDLFEMDKLLDSKQDKKLGNLVGISTEAAADLKDIATTGAITLNQILKYLWSGGRWLGEAELPKAIAAIEPLGENGQPEIEILFKERPEAAKLLGGYAAKRLNKIIEGGVTDEIKQKIIADGSTAAWKAEQGMKDLAADLKEISSAKDKPKSNFMRNFQATGAETQETGKTALERQKERLNKESKQLSKSEMILEDLKQSINSLKEEEKKTILLKRVDERRRRKIVEEARGYFREVQKAKAIEEQRIAEAKLAEEQKKIKAKKIAEARKQAIIEEAKQFFEEQKRQELENQRKQEESKKRDLAEKVNQFVEESLRGLKDDDANEVRKRLKGKKFNEIRSSIRGVIREVIEEGLRRKIDRKARLDKPVSKGFVQESKKIIAPVKKTEKVTTQGAKDPYDQAGELI